MDIDSIRDFCLSLPHATEDIQWGNDLLFRISGKIFAGMNLDPPHQFSFKCTPEKFDELIELEGIAPAPYMARNKWVMLERLDAVGDSEMKRLIQASYELVFAKLPKKAQAALGTTPKRGKPSTPFPRKSAPASVRESGKSPRSKRK